MQRNLSISRDRFTRHAPLLSLLPSFVQSTSFLADLLPTGFISSASVSTFAPNNSTIGKVRVNMGKDSGIGQIVAGNYSGSRKSDSNSFSSYQMAIEQADCARKESSYINEVIVKCKKDSARWSLELRRKAEEGYVSLVAKLLDVMETSAGVVVLPRHRNYYLEACIHAKESQKAMDFFVSLTAQQRDPDSYHKVMLACASAGDVAAIRKVMSIMKHLSLEISRSHWDMLINAVRIDSNCVYYHACTVNIPCLMYSGFFIARRGRGCIRSLPNRNRDGCLAYQA